MASAVNRNDLLISNSPSLNLITKRSAENLQDLDASQSQRKDTEEQKEIECTEIIRGIDNSLCNNLDGEEG